MAQSAGAVEYTDCISSEGYDSLKECPDMTLINLILKSQYCWRFGDVEFPMPSLIGPLWPGVVAPDRVQSIGHIELFWHL